MAQRSSQTAAVLLTLLVLKLVGTLRFVRRWVVIGRVLHRAWRELWAGTVLLLLLILLCSHLGNTLFSDWMEDFLSPRQAVISVLSILRGRVVLQRLCRVHPSLGPLYGVLIVGGGLWVLGRLCGAVLIRAYRSEQVEMYRPNIEPQDYEMVEFFIKRLKLWMGLTKAKEFRHRVKFEDMDTPPSRSSQDSCLSTASSPLPSFCSPSLSPPPSLSSALSIRSEDSSLSEPGFDVQPYLDRLLPCVNTLLSRFDRVNQITEDVHNLEMKIEEVQVRSRRSWIQDKEERRGRSGDSGKPKKADGEAKVTDVRHRTTGFLHPTPRLSLPSSLFFTPFTLNSSATLGVSPRIRSSHSESESLPLQIHPSPPAKFDGLSPSPAASPGLDRFPRRRAWHSGSSHSADTAQRIFQAQGGFHPCGNRTEHLALVNGRPRSQDGLRWRISDGVPVKRKAWICEGPESEQD